MKKILLILFFLTSCTSQTIKTPTVSATDTFDKISETKIQEGEPKLKPMVGDTPEPMFSDYINEKARTAKLTPLNKQKIKDDELEFRVWVGFGKKPLEGFVIKRTKGIWSGAYLFRRNLTSPKSGWEPFWGQLTKAGFLTLPDSSQLKGEVPVLDGTSYVVEIKQGQIYRTYFYGNPDYQPWPEAKQMLKIAEILYQEFGIKQDF